MSFRTILLALAMGSLLPGASQACSVFCLEQGDSVVVGRNHDWFFDEGLFVVNLRGQAKTAFTYSGEGRENLARWTARYGSVTFVQYGREVAFAGMNEAGLVVHGQWLERSAYPDPDQRPSVSVDQYVQYLLDDFGSVDEVVTGADTVRLRPTKDNFAKIHFFVADGTGTAAVLEYLGGKLQIHARDGLQFKAMTNDTYQDSTEYFAKVERAVPDGSGSLDRYTRIASLVADTAQPASADPIKRAFDGLEAVRQYGRYATRFQVVFDVKARVAYFRSERYPAVRHVRFKGIDFSCGASSKVLDLNANVRGDVTDRLVPYTFAANEKLIRHGWADLGSRTSGPRCKPSHGIRSRSRARCPRRDDPCQRNSGGDEAFLTGAAGQGDRAPEAAVASASTASSRSSCCTGLATVIGRRVSRNALARSPNAPPLMKATRGSSAG